MRATCSACGVGRLYGLPDRHTLRCDRCDVETTKTPDPIRHLMAEARANVQRARDRKNPTTKRRTSA